MTNFVALGRTAGDDEHLGVGAEAGGDPGSGLFGGGLGVPSEVVVS